MLERLERRMKLLPPPLKRLLKGLAWMADPLLRWEYRRRSGDRRPIPPPVLRARVGAGIRIDVYVGEGMRLAAAIEDALRAQGTSLAERRLVYDWGCGCGRLLSHLEGYAGQDTRIAGSDVDRDAVAWAARTWPHMTLLVNGFRPPLPVGDDQVDCLISSSIFTHLTEADQDLWLEEIRRVLTPDGYALVTVGGEAAFSYVIEGHAATRGSDFSRRLTALPSLEEQGFVFEPYDRTRWERADFQGITDVYGLAFHHPDYIHGHWGRWLELVDRRPAAVNHLQDLLLLRPRSEVAAAQDQLSQRRR